jgi:hypothetical protein
MSISELASLASQDSPNLKELLQSFFERYQSMKTCAIIKFPHSITDFSDSNFADQIQIPAAEFSREHKLTWFEFALKQFSDRSWNEEGQCEFHV